MLSLGSGSLSLSPSICTITLNKPEQLEGGPGTSQQRGKVSELFQQVRLGEEYDDSEKRCASPAGAGEGGQGAGRASTRLLT
uniref:Uncharacterized protein n=1 Tax=Globodera rostochiensis TaxID=31243 RepID=A0A914IDC0_GLORO